MLKEKRPKKKMEMFRKKEVRLDLYLLNPAHTSFEDQVANEDPEVWLLTQTSGFSGMAVATMNDDRALARS